MRDNELIINLCADISSQLRKYLIQLIEAGAPIDLCQDVMCALRNLENAPSALANSPRIDHYHGISINNDSAFAELMTRLAKIESLIQKEE